jgi:hypothetical protein
MPNGYARTGGRAGRRDAARTSYATRTKAARAAAVSKSRKKLATPAGRKTAITANTRAIGALRQQIYGPLQTQRSHSESGFYVVASRPVLFQVNNPECGAKGASILRETENGDFVSRIMGFNKASYSSGLPFYDKEEDNVVNGPKLLLKQVELQFKVHGFLDDTRVRIDVIRQKKVVNRNHWNYHDANEHFMPHMAKGLKNIAGFSSNEIDRNYFEVLATRHLYFNSKGSSNVADTTSGTVTSEATTPPTKYCKIDLKFGKGKVCKQLTSSVDQTSGSDAPDQDIEVEEIDAKGSYSWENQHPLSNVWCLISSDDGTAFGSLIDGDAVEVQILRKCVWRDFRG